MGVYKRRDSPYWWLWIHGRRQRTAFLIRDANSRESALELYYQQMLAKGRERHGLEPKRNPQSFTAYSTWWQEHVSRHHRGSTREAEIVATLQRTFGPRPLASLTREQVQEWMTARARKVKPSTVNRELDVLKQILNAAVPTHLAASPIARLKRLRARDTEARVLSRADEKKLLKQFTPADKAIALLALDALLRLSDAVNLRREHDHRTYLAIVDPKVRAYKVPVSRRLRAALDALPKNGPYYFPHRRQAKKARDYKSGIKAMLKRACEAAGVDYGRGLGITFHALRHTGATRMVEAGVPLRIVQAIGGWKSMRQLERYAHPSDEAIRTAVETVGRKRRF